MRDSHQCGRQGEDGRPVNVAAEDVGAHSCTKPAKAVEDGEERDESIGSALRVCVTRRPKLRQDDELDVIRDRQAAARPRKERDKDQPKVGG